MTTTDSEMSLTDGQLELLLRSALRRQQVVWLTLQGKSMQPTLIPGSAAGIVSAPPEALRPGRIIAFSQGGRVVVHRIVARRQGAGASDLLLLTKGDAAAPDEPVPGAAVIGWAKWLRLPDESVCSLTGFGFALRAWLWLAIWALQSAASRARHRLPRPLRPPARLGYRGLSWLLRRMVETVTRRAQCASGTERSN
jgi:hypothetical protein